MWYLITGLVCGGWVLIDSQQRKAGVTWAIVTALIPVIGLPLYLAQRPLKEGERREGGAAWNILKNFAMAWTILTAVWGISTFFSVASYTAEQTTDAERAGAALGATIGLTFIAMIWFFPMVGALLIGFFLRKSTVVEVGPTGPLASLSDSIPQNSPERTALDATGAIPAGKYLMGHPAMNAPVAPVSVGIGKTTLLIFAHEGQHVVVVGKIPLQAITNVEDQESGDGYHVTVTWADQKFHHATIFEFIGPSSVADANTLCNRVIQHANSARDLPEGLATAS